MDHVREITDARVCRAFCRLALPNTVNYSIHLVYIAVAGSRGGANETKKNKKKTKVNWKKQTTTRVRAAKFCRESETHPQKGSRGRFRFGYSAGARIGERISRRCYPQTRGFGQFIPRDEADVARRWWVWGNLVQRNEFSAQPLCGRATSTPFADHLQPSSLPFDHFALLLPFPVRPFLFLAR